MKNTIVLFAFAALILSACGSNSTDATASADSTAVDSTVDSSACCTQVDSVVTDSVHN